MRNSPSNSPAQINIPPHVFFGGLGLLIILAISVMGYSRQNIVFILAPLAIPVVLGLFLRPDLTLALSLTLFHTSLNLPGLPQSFDISRILLLIFIGSVIPTWIINKKAEPDPSWVRKITILYCVLLIVTMYVRGFGLRLLGSESWGGSEAILQYVFIVLLLFRNQISLSPGQWKFALICMLIGSAIPMTIDLLYILSGGATGFLYYAFAFNASSFISGMLASEHGIWRLQRAILFVPCLVQLSLYLYETRKINLFAHGFLIAIALLLAGVSGHRISLAILGVYFSTYYALRYRDRIGKQIILWILAVFVGFLGLFFTARFLPFPFQRAVASFEVIPISEEARRDAAGTTHWRLQVWREALHMVPRYFWIGRGLLLSSEELMHLRYIQNFYAYSGVRLGDIDEAIIRRDYHNGPLSLLLDLGIFGLLIGLGLMLTLSAEGVRGVIRKKWHNPDLASWHLLITCQIITEMIIFITIYGDVRTMMRFLLLGVISHGLRRTDDRLFEKEQRALEAEAARSKALARRPPIHFWHG